MFVDASALIAIIVGEPDADALAARLATAATRYTSAIAIWETVAGLRKSHGVSISKGCALVGGFVTDYHFTMVDIGSKISDLAIDAYDRFGKGRHPAALNMGDCFAYACAKHLGAGLLYKGEDFARTDLS